MPHTEQRSRVVLGLFVSVALIWGSTWVAIKVSLMGFQPLAGAAFRFASACLVLALYARYRRISLKLPAGALSWVLLTALLLYVFDYGLIYWGEQYLNAGVTSILFAVLPLATTVVSIVCFRSEPFRLQQLVGVLVGLMGIVAVFFDQLLMTDFGGIALVASLAIVGAAVAAAFSVVIAKKHLMNLDAVSLTFHQMLWGAVGLCVLAGADHEFSEVYFSAAALVAVLYLGLIGSALAFVMYYELLKRLSASTLSTITYLTPLVAVSAGWLLLDESLTGRVMLGALGIFVGIAIIQFDHLANLIRRRARSGIRAGAP